MTNAAYGKLTAGLIVAWFTFSLSASALHLFDTDPNRPPLPLLLAQLEIVSRVHSLAEPANANDRPGLAHRGVRVSGVVRLWHSARRLRVARRLGRCRNRCDRADRSLEGSQSALYDDVHPMAMAWNCGSDSGSQRWRRGPIHRHARSCGFGGNLDGTHDGAAAQRDSYLRCAFIPDSSHHLHSAGEALVPADLR